MRCVLGLVGLVLTAGAAAGQDLVVYGGIEIEALPEEYGPGTGTNRYLIGYVEAEVAGFYAGIWKQVVNDEILNEVGLYLGYRNETAAGVAYGVGYTRYYYPNDDFYPGNGDCCGEFTLALGVPLGDRVFVTLDSAYDPDAEIGEVYIGAAFAVTDVFAVSANWANTRLRICRPSGSGTWARPSRWVRKRRSTCATTTGPTMWTAMSV